VISSDLLKLPVYHGKMVAWDKEKFGKLVWPHVVVMNAEGKVVYMGPPDRTFEKVLRGLGKE